MKIIKEQLVNGIKKCRVGISPFGKAPARAGCEIFVDGGRKIGSITSGGYSPTLERPIAMGYVEEAFSKIGTEVLLSVRGKYLPAKSRRFAFCEAEVFSKIKLGRSSKCRKYIFQKNMNGLK